MNRLFYRFTLLALIWNGHFLNAQTTLRVINPQRQWQNQQGVIESAFLSIKPKGIYAEYGLYLTFSERGSGNSFTNDSLEVVLNFELPEAAIVHDSWLWIDDEIAVARIIDRWSASQIYEEIVGRNADPSLLVKNGLTSYSLRIFPLLKGSTRRVKITYLMPVSWTKNSATMELPTHILSASRINVPELTLLTWTQDQWEDPYIIGASAPAFSEHLDSLSGNSYYLMQLPHSEWTKQPKLKYDTPVPNGIYVNTWRENGEGIYQLAVVPALFVDNSRPRKVAILFDHEANGSNTFVYSEWLRYTRYYLENVLEPTDSFNLFFPQLIVTPHSPTWLPADPATIQQVFSSLSNTPGAYQQLAGLLSSAVQFIQQNGGDGHILVETNGSQFANITQSNALITDLLALMGQNLIPVSAVDLRVPAFPATSGLPGNRYLLVNLAQQTGGGYFASRSNSWRFDHSLEQGFINLWDRITNIEVNTSIQNGFCYGRLTPRHSVNYTSPIFLPVLQTGKFLGELPLQISVSGVINGNIFHRNFTIQEPDTYPGDSLNAKIWTGTFIQALEWEVPDYAGVPQIIDQSISARVLSRYTAFICLEDPSTYCDNCFDETQLTSTEDLTRPDSTIRIAPNPFVDQVEITVQHLHSGAGKTTMEVFDLSGRLISILAVEEQGSRVRAEWQGKDYRGADAPAGVYVLMIRNKQFTKAVRIVKARQ